MHTKTTANLYRRILWGGIQARKKFQLHVVRFYSAFRAVPKLQALLFIVSSRLWLGCSDPRCARMQTAYAIRTNGFDENRKIVVYYVIVAVSVVNERYLAIYGIETLACK